MQCLLVVTKQLPSSALYWVYSVASLAEVPNIIFGLNHYCCDLLISLVSTFVSASL